MAVQDVIDALVIQGCMVGHQFGVETVAAMVVSPGALTWVRMFPADQHHVHRVAFHRVAVVHRRDVAFYNADEELVAYVGPFSEWPEVTPDAFRDEQSQWEAYLAEADHRTLFEQFFQNQLSLIADEVDA